MNALVMLLSILIGVFFGAMIEGSEGWSKMITTTVFGSLAVIVALIIAGLWISKKVWEGRDNWYMTTSYVGSLPENDPQLMIDKDRRKQWRSPEPQMLDAWIELDMYKPRMIRSIEIITDDSGVEKPAEWRMMFYGRGGRTLSHKDGLGFIYVEDDIPQNVQRIRVEVKGVAEDMAEDTNYAKQRGMKVYWSVSLIKIREYRFKALGKRFWEHEV